MDLSQYELEDEVKEYLNQQEDFIIDRVSQEGGNGDIFFGNHKIFKRRIALKIYYGNDVSHTHDEPRILSTIEHPNILKIRDAKRIGDYYSYFMTDEIDGGDLEKIYQNGFIDLKDALNITHGILKGLTELHKKEISIVHRDIKPKNILILNESKTPLIADFGSVKQFDDPRLGVTGSKSTLIYKPREVFQSNLYTPQSDIYQVGVSLFQILGGFFPGAYVDWLTEAEKNKLKSITSAYEQTVFVDKARERLVVRDNLLRYETLPPYINQSIVKIIKRATHKDLQRRYSNTNEFMIDLYKVLTVLTNWKLISEELFAQKSNGDEYRIVKSSKGYVQEKKGKLGVWRRKGGFVPDINVHIAEIENQN